MITLVHPRVAPSARRALVQCPNCRHDDRALAPLVERFAAVLGRPRSCAYAVGDEISTLRNESCGCDHPLHSVGQRAEK